MAVAAGARAGFGRGRGGGAVGDRCAGKRVGLGLHARQEAELAVGDDRIARVDTGGDERAVAGVAGHGDGAELDGAVGLDDVDRGAVLAVLHGGRGDDDGAAVDADIGDDVDEAAGPERAILVGEDRLEGDHARRRVDGVVDEGEAAVVARDAGDPVDGADGGLPGGEGGADLIEHALGHTVGDRDGRELVDGDDGEVVVVGLHQRALVEETLAGAAGDGGANLGITELEFGIGDGGFLGLHGGVGGGGLGDVLDVLLFRDGGLAVEQTVAIEIGLGLLGVGAGGGEVGARAAEAVFERAAVEGDEEVAGLHVLTLLEIHLGNDAIDLGFDDDSAHGLHIADRLDAAGHVFLGCDGDLDGYGGRGGSGGGTCGGARFATAGEGEKRGGQRPGGKLQGSEASGVVHRLDRILAAGRRDGRSGRQRSAGSIEGAIERRLRSKMAGPGCMGGDKLVGKRGARRKPPGEVARACP